MEIPGNLFIHHSADDASASKDMATTIGLEDAIQLSREKRDADLPWEVINGEPSQYVP